MEPLDFTDCAALCPLDHCKTLPLAPALVFPNYLYNAGSVLGLHLICLVSVIMILGVSWLP